MGPLHGASSWGLFMGPLHGASSWGLFMGPLHGASSWGLFMGPLHGASSWGLFMGPLHGASSWGLFMGPLHGASSWGLFMGPLHGASSWGLFMGPLHIEDEEVPAMPFSAQQLSRRVARIVPVLAVATTLALALSGCGGGSGSAASWRTAEYLASNGLELIGAARGYASRTTGAPGGAGITVAVLDDGVYPHRDFGRFTEFRLPGVNVTRDHGTPVAGVIAARRNGRDGHGVAYNANLVSIATCNTCTISYHR